LFWRLFQLGSLEARIRRLNRLLWLLTALELVTRAVVVKHSHSAFEVVESLGVDPPYLLVCDDLAHDQLVEVVGRRVLLYSEQLADLADFKLLIYPALVLAVRRVEVVLDAVVGAARQLFSDIRPLVAQSLMQIEDFPLLISIDRIFLNVGVQVIVPPKK